MVTRVKAHTLFLESTVAEHGGVGDMNLFYSAEANGTEREHIGIVERWFDKHMPTYLVDGDSDLWPLDEKVCESLEAALNWLEKVHFLRIMGMDEQVDEIAYDAKSITFDKFTEGVIYRAIGDPTTSKDLEYGTFDQVWSASNKSGFLCTSLYVVYEDGGVSEYMDEPIEEARRALMSNAPNRVFDSADSIEWTLDDLELLANEIDGDGKVEYATDGEVFGSYEADVLFALLRSRTMPIALEEEIKAMATFDEYEVYDLLVRRVIEENVNIYQQMCNDAMAKFESTFGEDPYAEPTE